MIERASEEPKDGVKGMKLHCSSRKGLTSPVGWPGWKQGQVLSGRVEAWKSPGWFLVCVLLLVRFLEAVENSLRDVYTRYDQLKDKQSLSKDT